MMRYVLINTEVAKDMGYQTTGHRQTKDGRILLGEMEIVAHDSDNRRETAFATFCTRMDVKPLSDGDISEKLKNKEIIWQ